MAKAVFQVDILYLWQRLFFFSGGHPAPVAKAVFFSGGHPAPVAKAVFFFSGGHPAPVAKAVFFLQVDILHLWQRLCFRGTPCTCGKGCFSVGHLAPVAKLFFRWTPCTCGKGCCRSRRTQVLGSCNN